MNCAVCKKPLIVVERDGLELDFCPSCRGLWFDAGEIALLAGKLGRTPTFGDETAFVRAQSPEKLRPCPRCDEPMDKVSAGGVPDVLLDRCPRAHGLWFDHGELGTLFSGLATSPASHAEAVMHFMGETITNAAPAPEAGMGPRRPTG